MPGENAGATPEVRAVSMKLIPFIVFLDSRIRAAARLGRVRTLLLAAAVPLALRLLLLPVFPRPLPEVHDEFSYLLLADTFAHGRLVNPAPPLPEFFESFHILVTPVYASMYPVGEGLVLAAGQVLLGDPWWGVFASVGLMSAAVAWLLLAFVPPRWALAGALAFGLIYGVEHYFMNSYWGAPLATAAGAVMTGRSPGSFFRARGRKIPLSYGFLLGAGAGVLLHTRPWEGFCAALPAALVFAFWLVRSRWETFGRRLGRVALPALAAVGVAGAALLAYDARVTGDPLLPPYLMNLNRYYVAPLFLWQGERPIPAYDHDVMRRFYVDWRESERSVRQDVDAKNPLYGFWLWFHTFKIVGGARWPVSFFSSSGGTGGRRSSSSFSAASSRGSPFSRSGSSTTSRPASDCSPSPSSSGFGLFPPFGSGAGVPAGISRSSSSSRRRSGS